MAEKKGITNLYGILGLDENCDEAAIKKAYRVLVLRWHPDKNPADRQQAEEQIRRINFAYSMLSNPAKRERYDLQRFAADRRKRGEMPKPKVMSKMEVPKEFMMQPMGYVDKFLRCVDGKKVSVQARQDVKVTFDEFFRQTKLSLWWLPEVNNMCRIRNLGSKAKGDKKAAAAGLAGGLNFSFRAKAGFESEIMLVPAPKGQKSDTVNFVAKASPEFEGALRFETASRRGHYLAFLPPSDLRVVPFLNETPGRVLDFELLDFSKALNFKDIEEALEPVGAASPGKWVPMKKFMESADVREFFVKVLKKPVWDVEDFCAYFEGHWVDWDYNANDQTVRLRAPEERLGQVLRSCTDSGNALIGVGRAGDELLGMPLEGALSAIKLLTSDVQPGKSEDASAKRIAIRRKLLTSLRDILSKVPREALEPVGVAEVLDAAERVPLLVGDEPTPDLLEHRSDVVKLLAHMVVAKVTHAEEAPATSELGAEDLTRLLRIPGLPAHEEEALLPSVGPGFSKHSRASLLQAIRAAAARGCSSIAGAVAEAALAGMSESLHPDAAVAAIAELVEAGAPPGKVAGALAARSGSTSMMVLSRALLSLCGPNSAAEEAAAEGIRAAAEALAATAPLTELSTDLLVGLAVKVAKVPAMGPALEPVVEAAVAVLDSWPVNDVLKLLLAVAKRRDQLQQDPQKSLLAKAEKMLVPKLEDFNAADVVKVVLAVSGYGPVQLLEAAAKEAVLRLQDFSATQLLLLTQGFAQGLASDHLALQQILLHWPDLLARAEETPAPAGYVYGGPGIYLSPDQLAKLATALAPVLVAAEGTGGRPQEAARRRLVHSMCYQLLRYMEKVTEASRVALAPFMLDDGPFTSFGKRGKLRGLLLKRKRSRSRSLEGAAAEAVAAAGPSKRQRKKLQMRCRDA